MVSPGTTAKTLRGAGLAVRSTIPDSATVISVGKRSNENTYLVFSWKKNAANISTDQEFPVLGEQMKVIMIPEKRLDELVETFKLKICQGVNPNSVEDKEKVSPRTVVYHLHEMIREIKDGSM